MPTFAYEGKTASGEVKKGKKATNLKSSQAEKKTRYGSAHTHTPLAEHFPLGYLFALSYPSAPILFLYLSPKNKS